MKKSKLHLILSLAFLSILLSSCSAIAGIFKAGMGFGIFLVIAIVIVIIVLISRAGKNK
jgi:multisubunit Na+/H+ antiporter MnhB subunit